MPLTPSARQLSLKGEGGAQNQAPISQPQFMLTVLRFLEGIVIKEHNEDLWERTRSSVAATTLDGNRQPPVGVTTNHRAAERIE